jgi:CxxC-x17-CxxC domain-containing protein
MEEVTFFGKTNFRDVQKKIGIKLDDRRRHFYVIGKTGVGKTTLIKNMAIQDIRNGHGLAFLDPHGEACEELLDYIPAKRINDVIYINPADIEYPIAFNIMEDVAVEDRHLVASGLMSVFKKIWPDVWSARMEYILNNTILALLEYKGSTLLGIHRMLSDPDFRKEVTEKIKDPIIKAFWEKEFARYTQRYEIEATAAIQNKVGQFIASPLIRNIVGQVKTSFDMRDVMDNKKILIINLSKGKIGEDASRLLGALLITKLQFAAMSRVNIKEEERKDFFLYVDEFQNFATESFVNILSEARKYRLDLILAHQYITQMELAVKEAVFGNIGSLVVFRVGAEDAEFLEKEFSPEFSILDMVNLSKYQMCVKLMVNGVTTRPFSITSLPLLEAPETSHKEKIIKSCRERYSSNRLKVEEKIMRWASDIVSDATIPAAFNLYDTTCVLCGKKIKVPFLPKPGLPVYCKSCLRKNQEMAKEAPGERFKGIGGVEDKERANKIEKLKETLKDFLDRPII